MIFVMIVAIDIKHAKNFEYRDGFYMEIEKMEKEEESEEYPECSDCEHLRFDDDEKEYFRRQAYSSTSPESSVCDRFERK